MNKQDIRNSDIIRFDNKDDEYSLLINNYIKNINNKIINILKEKKIKEDQINKFVENLFDNIKVISLIKDNYSNGKTIEECSNEIIKKYYNIINNNINYLNKNFLTNRKLSGEGEISEIEE